MSFVDWMNGVWGRALRVVAGLAIIATGLAMGGSAGIVLAIVGLAPLAAGAAGVCLIAPLLGRPMRVR